jgi:hypothetical protein
MVDISRLCKRLPLACIGAKAHRMRETAEPVVAAALASMPHLHHNNCERRLAAGGR